MNDKELMELSAKGSGFKLDYRRSSNVYYYEDPEIGREEWLPLDDDRQSLRLAVNLDMMVNINRVDGFTEVACGYNNLNLVKITEPHGDDMYEATRYAIVRAAAEIGKQL